MRGILRVAYIEGVKAGHRDADRLDSSPARGSGGASATPFRGWLV